MAHQNKLPLGMLNSLPQCCHACLILHFQLAISTKAQCGRQQIMFKLKCLNPYHPPRENQMELLSPGFCLAKFWLLQTFGEKPADGKYLCLSLPPSCHSAFQIVVNKYIKILKSIFSLNFYSKEEGERERRRLGSIVGLKFYIQNI